VKKKNTTERVKVFHIDIFVFFASTFVAVVVMKSRNGETAVPMVIIFMCSSFRISYPQKVFSTFNLARTFSFCR
jgi:hypothetical protein